MPSPPRDAHSTTVERVHTAALGVASLGLALGLASRRADWVGMGVALVLLLSPLRIATSVLAETHARRYGVAAMGVVVLMVLFLSRHIS